MKTRLLSLVGRHCKLAGFSKAIAPTHCALMAGRGSHTKRWKIWRAECRYRK